MPLPKFAELTTSNRGAPCQEYPGEWLVHLPLPYEGKTEYSHTSQVDAYNFAHKVMIVWESEKKEYEASKVSVSWTCNDNDPRQGKVWFTGYYTHGKFNIFGDYKST